MRFRLNLLMLLGLGLLAWPAVAQAQGTDTSDKPADESPAGDSEMKQKLVDNFDTNKDGKLDRSEARAIGRALRENFGIGPGPGGPGAEGRRRAEGPPPGEGRGPEGRRGRGRGSDDGPPPGDRGPRGPRGEEGGGERGPGNSDTGRPDGPPRPPRPERLFNRFDENEDGSLSLEEFISLTEFVRENRPPGPPMDWRGGRGRGFDGPPRGDFDRRGGEGRRGRDWRDGPPGDGPPPADDGGKVPDDSI